MAEQWQQVGDVLDALLKKMGLSAEMDQWRAMQGWKSAAGDKISGKTHPVRVQNGILWLQTAGPQWTAEVSMRKQEILDALNKEFGRDVLKDIRFVGAWEGRKSQGR